MKKHFFCIKAKTILLPFYFISLWSENDGSFRFFFILFLLRFISVLLQISSFRINSKKNTLKKKSKWTKFCFHFASFRLEGKMTAHPSQQSPTVCICQLPDWPAHAADHLSMLECWFTCLHSLFASPVCSCRLVHIYGVLFLAALHCPKRLWELDGT